MSKSINKIHIHRNKDLKYEAEIEYKDDDGKITSGDTQLFDNFSLASAWVAGVDVDLRSEDKQEHESDDLS